MLKYKLLLLKYLDTTQDSEKELDASVDSIELDDDSEEEEDLGQDYKPRLQQTLKDLQASDKDQYRNMCL